MTTTEEKTKVKALYSEAPEEELEEIVPLHAIKRCESKFLSGENPENKASFQKMIIGYIATNMRVMGGAWKEAAATISYVKANGIYLKTSNCQTLESWLNDVLLPILDDKYGITEKAGTIQMWANYYDLEQEISAYSPEAGKNILEMNLGVSEWRRLLSLAKNPHKLFKAYADLPGFGEAKKDLQASILVAIAEKAEQISVSPKNSTEDSKKVEGSKGVDDEGVSDRNNAVAKHYQEVKEETGKILAEYFLQEGEIQVGKYYKYTSDVSWGEPRDTETGTKWEKFTVPGVKNDWVKVVQYDPEAQTVRVKPWMVFQLELSKEKVREKYHMNTDGVILHDLSVANLDPLVALTQEDVEYQQLDVSMDLTFDRPNFRVLHNHCKVNEGEMAALIDQIIQEWAEAALEAQKEKDQARSASAAKLIEIIPNEEEVA